MALLHLRKTGYIIRNVEFSWIFFLSLKRNLQYMRNTHTNKQTSKCSTHAFCRIFWNIFYINSDTTNTSNTTNIIKKIHLDAQIKEYNTKLSTTPNTYDDSQNNTNTTPKATQLQNLNHNYPLLLVPQNFRNIALTDLITLRSNYPQIPIQHIITHPTTQYRRHIRKNYRTSTYY